ncbi:nuclear transport factor 2 family protein [Pseudonocardia xishanensis]|uniref:SnoaL-like domain-containing protein n=1 Tax=Pseudonocardia xishanensis TaxID=630995 RepID=A0ABP8RSC9_9PSEU
MSTVPLTPAPVQTAGRLVDAVAAQDFAALRRCLTDAVRFRALLPPGAVEIVDPVAATDRFLAWFGGPDRLEVLDTVIGAIGSKASVRWRVRRTAPDGTERLVEQHLFVTGDGRLDTLDLLCSGFVGR